MIPPSIDLFKVSVFTVERVENSPSFVKFFSMVRVFVVVSGPPLRGFPSGIDVCFVLLLCKMATPEVQDASLLDSTSD